MEIRTRCSATQALHPPLDPLRVLGVPKQTRSCGKLQPHFSY
ncbi:MAG: hypothetical protein OJF62_001053 [Pseudolabrys sp.]|nr:hypothetical protein [Pseudolabrys sp.]